MARLALQVKNVASLCLSLGTSIATGMAAKRFFDSPRRAWGWLAVAGAGFFLCQVALVLFLESKEEEELSLLRQQRLGRTRHAIEDRAKITLRIQQEFESGIPESAANWLALRERIDD